MSLVERNQISRRQLLGLLAIPAITVAFPRAVSAQEPQLSEETARLRETLGIMQNSPAFKVFSDRLVARQSRHNYVGEVKWGESVSHVIVGLKSEQPTYPYIPVWGLADQYPGTVMVGVGMPQNRSEDLPLTSVLSLAYTVNYNESIARRVATWLNAKDVNLHKTPDQAKQELDKGAMQPAVIEASAFGIDFTMKAYEASKDGLEQLGLTDSILTKDLYPAWQAVNALPEGQDRQRALEDLARNFYFGGKS